MSIPAVPTILIVDDDEKNRRLLAVLLQPEGYNTSGAASGEEALCSIASYPPDLILLDIMMPGIDGYQVASILKANPSTANIPIIMVTSESDRTTRLAGLEAGAEEFLTKPVDRTELWLRVRNLLRLKAYSELEHHSLILEQQVRARTADLQRFRTAMDATADAIMLISRDTMRFVEVNATACSMLGYTRAEMFEIGPSALGAATSEQLRHIYDDIIAGDERPELSEAELRCKDGALIQVEVNRRAMRSGDDWIIVSVVRDVSARKQAEQQLQHQAHHDALTHLPNRTLFHGMLRETIAVADANGWKVAVMFIDLDHFKNVNDTLGHTVGDALLLQFSERLLACVSGRDKPARLGGDEFALILLMDGQASPARAAVGVQDALRTPFHVAGYEILATASIGITIYPDDTRDPDVLTKYADTAMFQAKQAGRDTYRFFTAQMNTDVLVRQELENALRKATDNEEFVLHYQPKVNLATGQISGVEALLRWDRPGHGLVPPSAFVSVLEESGLIVRVGAWVIRAASRQIKSWLSSDVGAVRVSVNVAERQFFEGGLAREVILALEENMIPADLLELELTETSLMLNTERTIECLRSLRDKGVHVSIDDFGTGYSSLAYLRRFPIDKLKIDIAFIREVTTNPDDAVIVRTIISMAHSLNLAVIAEGVETLAQLAFLRCHHCDQIQGYLFSRPLPLHEATEFLGQHVSLPVPSDRSLPSPTLLLVDDEAFIVKILTSLFEDEGYHILWASSALAAFDILAQQDVHVILCDQHMPQMNGTAFLEKVTVMYPGIFRIVLSADTHLEPMMAAVNSGTIDRFYTKPWNNNALLECVRSAFSGAASQRADAAGSTALPYAAPCARAIPL